jgi:predicted nucleotidyltransferase
VLTEALSDARRLAKVPYEVYVQGSYANDTNIAGDSDVDLVIQLKLPFEEQLRDLTPPEVVLFFEVYGPTDYGWDEFRQDVIDTLRDRYWVHEGNKCIDITDVDSLLRVPADILPAIEYRHYRAFPGLAGELYDEGVFFRDGKGRAIRNFPKQHLANGRVKNRSTGGRFKEIVRTVKNARRHESAGLEGGTAPSYFIECLLFNVPDDVYRRPLVVAYRNCLDWLLAAEISSFPCQNTLVDLFGTGPDQWNTGSARRLLECLDQQWVAGCSAASTRR